MSNRITCVIGLLLLLLCSGVQRVQAQDEPVAVKLDHAVFAYSDSTSLLELYFAFTATTLPFEAAASGYRASMPVTVQVVSSRSESEVVWSDSLVLQFTVSDTTEMRDEQMFLHQLRAGIPPGRYTVRLDQPDNAAPDQRVRTIERELVVEDYSKPGAAQFSEIALASRIQRSDERQSPFYKHGLLIRPNPRLVYGPGLSRLYYYVELYRPGTLTAVDEEYRVYAYVTPVHQNTPADSLKRAVDRKVRSPDVLVGHFNVGSLPSGSYELRTEVRDRDGEAVVSQQRRFFIYNPDATAEAVPQETGPAISARYRSMNATMVDIAVAATAEIASESERSEIQQLTGIEEKRHFLTRFWTRRDETPGTAENEAENQFYRRLRTVREQYHSPFKEAWETDRGRTMLMYGSPSQIDSYLHERETQPYVIWYYDHIPGEGRARFVFIDREGFGEFDLVHSTARGEVKNPEWRRLIQ